MIDRSDYFVFVVDTDTYAGNFERALTAFATGVLGECGVGDEEAAMFVAAHPDRVELFENLMAQVADEHGCHRPTSIYTTPGMLNDGMGNEYPEARKGDPDVIARYRETLRTYRADDPSEFQEEDIETAMPLDVPAYFSVGMFMGEEPSEEVVEFIKSRVREFVRLVSEKNPGERAPGKWNAAFKVTGYRLVRESVQVHELRTWGP